MKFLFPVLAGLSMMFLTGCQQSEENYTDEEVGTKTYNVRGVVQEIRNEGKVLVIDHEEIPGYMRQMIMPFKVADQQAEVDLAPGDEIEFVYQVEDVTSRIFDIKKTGVTKEVKLGSADDIPDPDDVKILSVGDVLPDYEFTDQDGKDVKLSSWRGMPIAMSFVFSRCPVPEYCPAMMRNFNEVEEALKNDPDAPEQWKLLSISFDTWMESPETMKAYGEAYGRDSGQWSLLSTDHCCTIHEIAGNVGLKFADKDGSFIHNLRTVVLDGEGRIVRIFTDETWQVSELIAEMKKLGNPGT